MMNVEKKIMKTKISKKLQKLLNSPVHCIFPKWKELNNSQDRRHLIRINFLSRDFGIYCVGILSLKTEKELLRYRGMGIQAIKFIQKHLAEHGLELGMSFEPGVISSPLNEVSMDEFFGGIRKDKRTVIIHDLEKGVNTTRIFYGSPLWVNARCPIGLTCMTEDELRSFSSFNHRYIEYTKRRLAEYGHTLWQGE